MARAMDTVRLLCPDCQAVMTVVRYEARCQAVCPVAIGEVSSYSKSGRDAYIEQPSPYGHRHVIFYQESDPAIKRQLERFGRTTPLRREALKEGNAA